MEERTADCPYCGEPMTLWLEAVVDPPGPGLRDWIEDCPVCCQPVLVEVSHDVSGMPQQVWLRQESA